MTAALSDSFQYYMPTRIVSGAGCFDSLYGRVKVLGNKPMIKFLEQY